MSYHDSATATRTPVSETPQRPGPDPALRQLDRFVGSWVVAPAVASLRPQGKPPARPPRSAGIREQPPNASSPGAWGLTRRSDRRSWRWPRSS